MANNHKKIRELLDVLPGLKYTLKGKSFSINSEEHPMLLLFLGMETEHNKIFRQLLTGNDAPEADDFIKRLKAALKDKKNAWALKPKRSGDELWEKAGNILRKTIDKNPDLKYHSYIEIIDKLGFRKELSHAMKQFFSEKNTDDLEDFLKRVKADIIKQNYLKAWTDSMNEN